MAMQSFDRRMTSGRAVVERDRQPSPWARTVVVIRIPRFILFDPVRHGASMPDDPLAAFSTETQLRAHRRRIFRWSKPNSALEA